MEKAFKKTILLLFVAVLSMSCEKVQTITMAMQANLNDEFFRAYSVSAQANTNDQMITIFGRGGNNEKLVLHTQWSGATSYDIGADEVSYATYKTADDIFYTTRSQGSSGTITITNQDEVNQELTGEFNLVFITETDTLTVSRGMFYTVPYEITN